MRWYPNFDFKIIREAPDLVRHRSSAIDVGHCISVPPLKDGRLSRGCRTWKPTRMPAPLFIE